MQKKYITATVSALLLTVTLAACGSNTTTSTPTTPLAAAQSSAPASASTAPSAPSAPASASTQPSTPSQPSLTAKQAQAGSAKLVTDFYNGTFKLSHAKIQAVQKLNLDKDSYSASAYTAKMEALVPALKKVYKDDATTDEIAGFDYAYTSTIASLADLISSSKNASSFKFVINENLITVEDNNTVGVVPAAAIGAEYNGQTQTNSSSTSTLHTIYKNGTWYLDAAKSV